MPSDHPTSIRGPTAPPLLRRAARAGAVAVVATAALACAAHLALNAPAVRATLRTRIADALRARVGAVTLGDEVSVDWLLRVSFGPVTIPASRRGAPPLLRVERVRVRPRLAALLAGRAEPSSVRLEDVHLSPGPGGRELTSFADHVPAARRRDARAAPRPSADRDEPTIRFRDLVVSLSAARGPIEVGPFDGAVASSRRGATEASHVEVDFPGGGRAALDLVRDPGGWHARGGVDRVTAAAIPTALRSSLVSLPSGAFSVQLTANAAADLAHADAMVRVDAEDVRLAGDRLAPEPIGPVTVAGAGTLRWDRASRRVVLRDGALTLFHALPLGISGEARLAPGVPFSLSVHAEGVDYRELVAALPPALAPADEAPRPTGTFDFRFQMAGPLLSPADWTLDAALDLARLREAARRAPPVALRAPFTYRPEVEEGSAPEIRVGPANREFVPISALPEHVIRAVTTSEDASFFAHPGFDFQELRNAFAEGAEAGRVVRGGSTITQQLAKNLYLSREKTLSRKVREAMVTIALESTVPKWRLLEIYLNVAEWGPGLYGIGPAARHYFGKDARELTPKEAAFLASIIPNPVRYHVMYARGALTNGWEQRVETILEKMGQAGALSQEQLLDALRQPLVFARG